MTRKLFQKYDEETEQWLLQDIRDWPIDKFEIKAGEGDGAWSGGQLGFIQSIAKFIYCSFGMTGFCLLAYTKIAVENEAEK